MPKLEDSLEGATPVHEFPLIEFINPYFFNRPGASADLVPAFDLLPCLH